MLFSAMSLELKLENICQSTVEWLLTTQMQFLRKLQFLKNMEPRLLRLKVHRRAAERATPSKEAGAPCKHHSHP